MAIDTNTFINIPSYGYNWKEPVSTAANLPPAGNELGDTRLTLDTLLIWAWNGNSWQNIGGGVAPGTVTSVGITVPAALLSVTGSPVTSSGTFMVMLQTQAANTVFAGPASGPDDQPTFRDLVPNDIPALPYQSNTLANDQIWIGNSSNIPTARTITGDISISNTGVSIVNSVGGSSAANIHSAELAANAATNLNTASTIVERDASGNFSAGTITASLIGNVTGNVSGNSSSFTGSLSGDVAGTQSATVIQPNVVSNSKLAQMATNTIKGNNTGSTANASDLTISQVNSLLGTVTSVTASSPLASSGGATPNISITGSSLTEAVSSILTITGGSTSQLDPTTIQVSQATTSTSGYLSSTDWNTFNNKFSLPILTSGSVLFSNGTTIAQDNAQFFWDDTNYTLGLGTNIPASNTVIDIVNNAGGNKAVQATGYGSNVGYRGRRAGGTLASPTASQLGDVLSFFSGRGYGATQFAVASTGAVNIVAAEAFTDTSNATYLSLMTTVTGNVTSQETARFSTLEQLRLVYDANDYATFVVDSTSSLTIAPTTSTGNRNGGGVAINPATGLLDGVGGVFTVTGGVGGAGSSTAGAAGGAVIITSGIGGIGSATSGNGGVVNLLGGAGGAGTGGGNGGNAKVAAGNAGLGSSTSGNGGALSLFAGNAAAAAGSNGGNVSIDAGFGSSTGSGGASGSITIATQNAGGDDTVNRQGGSVSLAAGNSKGSSAGGGITMLTGNGGGGTGSSASSGGSATVTAGAGGTNATTSGTGGQITLNAGPGGGTTANTTAGGAGGGILIRGGAAGNGSSSAGAGGSVTISGGVASTSTIGSNGGAVTIAAGAGTSTGSGGAGGNASLAGGNAGGDNTVNQGGGTLTLSSGNSKGSSNGAQVQVTSGTGGLGTGATGSNGGQITITSGAGGLNATTSGNGGALTYTAGVGGGTTGGSATGGVGGAATFKSGAGGLASTTSGAGGLFTLQAGAGGNSTGGGTNGSGGALLLASGSPGTGGSGGANGIVQIKSGTTLSLTSTAAGLIGIGNNASPTYLLDVLGGNIGVGTAGDGIFIKEGSNAKQGTATLSGGTKVVTNSSVTANSRIFLTAQSLGTITTPAALAVTARSAGTNFTITSSANNDTSIIAYEIFEPY